MTHRVPTNKTMNTHPASRHGAAGFRGEMKTLIKLTSVIVVVSLASCTDAKRAKLGSLGDEHTIELYSGGKQVRQWTSTGKVHPESSSDGYYFSDKESGKLIEVSGDVVITRN